MRYDAVIIGAGMSGLACGARLARFGKKTLIAERHYRVGGLNSFYRAGGYDLNVGLHAITNYNPDGPKSAPMARLLRRLQIRMEDLELAPQQASSIVFPSATLKFGNGMELLTGQVRDTFPGQEAGLRKMADIATDLYQRGFHTVSASARQTLSSLITEPLLVEMLMAPAMFYGCPTENDMDFGLFSLLFMSVFMEGLARPQKGVRPILDRVVNDFQNDGGVLRLQCAVDSIAVEDGKIRGVTLEGGEHVECSAVLSSAGMVETMAMLSEQPPGWTAPPPGVISFVESINVLDTAPARLGIDSSIIFYSNADTFVYRRPDKPVDLGSGIICFPSNFRYDEPMDIEKIRITHIADPDFWEKADEGTYSQAKETWREKSMDSIRHIIPDFREHVVFHDIFTPRSIKRFTSHLNGAVYGAPDKVHDGATPVENLFIVGTDQGFMGVVGAMTSGVAIAGRLL